MDSTQLNMNLEYSEAHFSPDTMRPYFFFFFFTLMSQIFYVS